MCNFHSVKLTVLYLTKFSLSRLIYIFILTLEAIYVECSIQYLLFVLIVNTVPILTLEAIYV